MRTEVIGLNAWLASVQVPGISAGCPCGWSQLTVRHIVLHCPRYQRQTLLERCGTERLDEILSKPESATHAARWLVATGALEQFRVARDIAEEDLSAYRPLSVGDGW